MMKELRHSDTYKRYRLRQWVSLVKYCFTLVVLLGLILWAPNQAAQFTGYLGAFILGGTKLKALIGR
jgi:fumarate reductase subunit C